jgi:hypothetical protein
MGVIRRPARSPAVTSLRVDGNGATSNPRARSLIAGTIDPFAPQIVLDSVNEPGLPGRRGSVVTLSRVDHRRPDARPRWSVVVRSTARRYRLDAVVVMLTVLVVVAVAIAGSVLAHYGGS